MTKKGLPPPEPEPEEEPLPEIAVDVPQVGNEINIDLDISEDELTHVEGISANVISNELGQLKTVITNLEKELEQTQLLLKKEKSKTGSLTLTLRKSREFRKSRITLLEKQLKIARDKKSKVGKGAERELIRNFLLKKFTKAQTNVLLGNSKRANWGFKDIVVGFTLQTMSPKAYRFIREKHVVPLPSVSFLNKWLSNFTCLPGIQHKVIDILGRQLEKSQQDTQSKTFPLASLTFDEVSIAKTYQFQRKAEQLFGPVSNAQVAMLRGITHPWKDAVYYDFDKAMTVPILFSLIKEVEKRGILVCNLGNDLGPKNQGLLKELKVTPDKPYFQHPFDENRKIYVLLDVPHLLKLLRNHVLDNGFTLESGTTIDKTDFLKLFENNKSELKINPKFKEEHLQIKGQERQRVRPAARLFSNTTAKQIRFLDPNNEEKAAFVQLANDSFDVLNSRFKHAGTWQKSAYGTSLKEQEQILLEMEQAISKMTVGNRKAGSFVPFQKGYLISCKSVRLLFNDLKEKYGLEYLMTSHLNQDCLENFFSRIRCLFGSNQHPGPVEFMDRFRKAVLGKSVAFTVPNAVVTCEGEEEEEDPVVVESLTADLFQNYVNEAGFVFDDEGDSFLQEIEGTALQDPDDGLQSNDDNDDDDNNLIINENEYKDCHLEALKMIAGYIAFKHKDQFPDLSQEEFLQSPEESKFQWIEHLSRGGLTKPSDSWMKKIMEFENIFSSLHGTDFCKEGNVIKKLQSRIYRLHPDIDMSVIKCYATVRTYARIKYLNSEIKRAAQLKREARKARQFAT